MVQSSCFEVDCKLQTLATKSGRRVQFKIRRHHHFGEIVFIDLHLLHDFVNWFLDLICKLLIPTHEGGNQVGGNFLTSRTRQQSPENLTVNTHIWGKYTHIWGKYTHKYTNTNTQIHIHLGQPYQLSQYLSTLDGNLF